MNFARKRGKWLAVSWPFLTLCRFIFLPIMLLLITQEFRKCRICGISHLRTLKHRLSWETFAGSWGHLTLNTYRPAASVITAYPKALFIYLFILIIITCIWIFKFYIPKSIVRLIIVSFVFHVFFPSCVLYMSLWRGHVWC